MKLNLKSLLRSESLILFVVVLLGLTALSLVSGQFLKTFNLYVLVYNIALATLVAFGLMVVVDVSSTVTIASPSSSSATRR